MTTRVKVLQACGDYAAGAEVTMDAKRAQRLARTGYVQLLDAGSETAVSEGAETATRPRPGRRDTRAERRG